MCRICGSTPIIVGLQKWLCHRPVCRNSSTLQCVYKLLRSLYRNYSDVRILGAYTPTPAPVLHTYLHPLKKFACVRLGIWRSPSDTRVGWWVSQCSRQYLGSRTESRSGLRKNLVCLDCWFEGSILRLECSEKFKRFFSSSPPPFCRFSCLSPFLILPHWRRLPLLSPWSIFLFLFPYSNHRLVYLNCVFYSMTFLTYFEIHGSPYCM